MAIVYLHRGKDNGEIFYVGIGKDKRRAVSDYKRSRFWHDYVKKHSYEVEIILEDITWEDACKKETELIRFYGRRDIKTGSLVNMTGGGAGGSTMQGRKNPSLSDLNRSKKGKPGLKLLWFNKDGVNTRATVDMSDKMLSEGWSKGVAHNPNRKVHKGIKPWNKGLSGYKINNGASLRGKKKPTYKRGKINCPQCGIYADSTFVRGRHLKRCQMSITTLP